MRFDAISIGDFLSLSLDHGNCFINVIFFSVDGSRSILVLSLYSYYNLVVKGKQRLHFPSYTKREYYKDKPLSINNWD